MSRWIHSINEQNGGEYSDNRLDVYSDITVVRGEVGSRWAPIIIAEIRDSHDVIVDDLTSYMYLGYVGAGVDFDICTDDFDTKEEDGNDGSYAMCNNNDEKVRVKFRLSNLPIGLDIDKLIQQIIDVYTQLLEGSIAKFKVLDIEQSHTVDLSSFDKATVITQDVFLDISVKRKFEVADFTQAVNDKLSSSRDEILNVIQLYTDTLTELDVRWCINDEGAYAICPQSAPSKFRLPNWAIITITVISVILACCIC